MGSRYMKLRFALLPLSYVKIVPIAGLCLAMANVYGYMKCATGNTDL